MSTICFSREKAIKNAVVSATPKALRSTNTAGKKPEQTPQTLTTKDKLGELLAATTLAGIAIASMVGFAS